MGNGTFESMVSTPVVPETLHDTDDTIGILIDMEVDTLETLVEETVGTLEAVVVGLNKMEELTLSDFTIPR